MSVTAEIWDGEDTPYRAIQQADESLRRMIDQIRVSIDFESIAKLSQLASSHVSQALRDAFDASRAVETAFALNKTFLEGIKIPRLDLEAFGMQRGIADLLSHMDVGRFEVPAALLQEVRMPLVNFGALELATRVDDLPAIDTRLLQQLRDEAARTTSDLKGEIREVHQEVLVIASEIRARPARARGERPWWAPTPFELWVGLMAYWANEDVVNQHVAEVGRAIGRMIEYLTYFSYHRPG